MSIVNKILTESDFDYREDCLYHGSPKLFDKFDLSFVKTGDGLNKYGRGIYLTTSYSTARYYALRGYVYHVKAYNISDYREWESEVDEDLQRFIIRKMTKAGFEDEAERVQAEWEEYQDTTWSLKMLYDFLAAVIEDEEVINEWLQIYGIVGIIADEPAHDGRIYIAFDPDSVRILEVEDV